MDSQVSLYCEEEHWDNGELITQDYFNFIEGEGDSSLLQSPLTLKPFLDLLHQDLWQDEELSSLLHKEQETEPYHDFEENPSRGEAVEWMLKVIAYYSFSALTAVLAVNYLDRFLHGFSGEKPWMTHLAAVACLSLAAKVEETQVPLLLDLQVEESKYMFESKTIQKMEILVLSTLQWKMNPLTPLSFLDCIARTLGFHTHISREFLRRCQSLLLSLLSDCRLISYLPSAMATATMMYVISTLEPSTAIEHREQLIGILGATNKEKVEECCRVIQEVGTRLEYHESCNKRRHGSLLSSLMPGSPKGVVDVCFSSEESSIDSSICPTASVSSSPLPLSKKIKSK